MIKESMFFGSPTVKDYRDMKLEDVLKEYLLFKGTRDRNDVPCNQDVAPKELVGSALFVYNLKNNATNKSAILYYCERQARQNLWFRGGKISIPKEIWEECDKYNKEHTGR